MVGTHLSEARAPIVWLALPRDRALRPRTNLTRSVMQEPTTTTAAASSFCQGLPGSPDAAITNPCSTSTLTLSFALCLTP